MHVTQIDAPRRGPLPMLLRIAQPPPAMRVWVVCLVLTVAATVALPVQAQPTLGYDTDRARVLGCPIHAVSYDECDTQEYSVLLIVYAAPCLLVAAMVALFMVMYFLSKYLCDCCGGRRQSPNFCCPNKQLPAKYSTGDLLRPLVVSAICVVACIAACTWGFIGFAQTRRQLAICSEIADDVELQQSKRMDVISAKLVTPVYDVATNEVREVNLLGEVPEGQNMEETLKAVLLDSTEELTRTFANANHYARLFSNVGYALYLFSLLVCLLGLTFGFCNIRRFGPMALVWVLFLLCIAVWCYSGVMGSAQLFTYDMCREVFAFTQWQENVASVVVGCNEAQVQAVGTNYDAAMLAASRAACDDLVTLCYHSNTSVADNVANGRVLECPDPDSCSTMTLETLRQWVQTSLYTSRTLAGSSADVATAIQAGYVCPDVTQDTYMTCDLQRCSEECVEPGSGGGALSSVGKHSRRAISVVEALHTLAREYDTSISTFTTCESLLTEVVPQLSAPCRHTKAAIAHVRGSAGLLSLTLLAAITSQILGAKRFFPMSEAFVAQFDK